MGYFSLFLLDLRQILIKIWPYLTIFNKKWKKILDCLIKKMNFSIIAEKKIKKLAFSVFCYFILRIYS